MTGRTPGSRALLEVLSSCRLRDVAELIGVSHQAVSAWASGQKRPNKARRVALWLTLGIDPTDWEPESLCNRGPRRRAA